MIKISLRLDSILLHMPVTIQVALPQLLSYDNEKVKSVWCLHCAMADGDLFLDRLNLLDLVEDKKFAVICPSLPNSHFVNSEKGNYADFLELELYPYLHSVLPLSTKREDNICLGISMGAFGALLLSLKNPNFFSKVICISGYYDFRFEVDPNIQKQRKSNLLLKLIQPSLQKAVKDSNGDIKEDCDISKLISKISTKDKCPEFNLLCGNNDLLSKKQSTIVVEMLQKKGLKTDFFLINGEHDIKTWRKCIERAFYN